VKEEIKNLIKQIIESQEEKLFHYAEKIVPHITQEDLLQPMDYPELETNPYFRYEEGVLAGMHSIRAALLAYLQGAQKDA